MINGYQYSEVNNPLGLDNDQGSHPSQQPDLERQSISVEGSPSEPEDELSRNSLIVLDNPSNPSDNLIQPVNSDHPPAGQTRPSTSESLEERSQQLLEIHKSFDWAGSWIWEVGGATLSAVCIGLLIGFLAYVDGMSYAGWQYSISPNAAVSVISAFAKASMLVPVSACLGQLKWKQDHQAPKPLYHFQILDQASRGPWGALQVFWTVRSYFAMAGATLVILSLALDPFAQQILAFPSRELVAHNETAYVQRAQTYGAGWASDPQRKLLIPSSLMDPTMQTALLTGLAGINNPLEPSCPTAHCDYPDFATLGICTACEDVTEQTTQTCKRLNSNSTFDWIISGGDKRFASIPANCTYLTPSGLRFAPEITNMYRNHDQVGVTHQPLTSIIRETLNGDSLVSFSTAKYSQIIMYTLENTSKVEEKPQITECSVYLCEQLYTQNHVSASDRTFQPSKSQPLDIKGPIDRETYMKTRQYEFSPRDGAATFGNSTYAIDSTNWESLGLMTSLFNTTLAALGGIESSPSDTNIAGVRLGPILYASNNIVDSMRRMATSMTDSIRSRNEAIHVPGRAFTTQTYIHVRWPWVILPAVSVVFSILLFIATILASRGQAVLWKSSILPLMMGRLETTPEHQIAHIRNLDEVQSIAKNVRVVVEEEKDRGPLLFSER